MWLFNLSIEKINKLNKLKPASDPIAPSFPIKAVRQKKKIKPANPVQFNYSPSPWTALSSLTSRSVRDKSETSTLAVTFSEAGIINLCNAIWLISEKFIMILLCVLALSFLTPLAEWECSALPSGVHLGLSSKPLQFVLPPFCLLLLPHQWFACLSPEVSLLDTGKCSLCWLRNTSLGADKETGIARQFPQTDQIAQKMCWKWNKQFS